MTPREEKPSTAWLIFNKNFLCQVQRLHLITKEDIEIYGVPCSGERDVDDASLRAFQHIQLTIAQMVEFHERGVSIIIDDPKQSVVIYELIKEHLSNHLDHVQNAINKYNVPIDDLRAMDRFAAAIFPIARQYKEPEKLQISKGIQALLSAGPNVFDPLGHLEQAKKQEDKPTPVITHRPLAEDIAKAMSNNNKGIFR